MFGFLPKCLPEQTNSLAKDKIFLHSADGQIQRKQTPSEEVLTSR